MTYTYEGVLKREEENWFTTIPAFPDAFLGDSTVKEACEGEAMVLQLVLQDDEPISLTTSQFVTAPKPLGQNPPCKRTEN